MFVPYLSKIEPIKENLLEEPMHEFLYYLFNGISRKMFERMCESLAYELELGISTEDVIVAFREIYATSIEAMSQCEYCGCKKEHTALACTQCSAVAAKAILFRRSPAWELAKKLEEMK